tara:strand:+ start:321 stop:914 length:594 start_codon:yes stop_codon:yes gene_type:complete
MRARMALKLAKISYELREVFLKEKPIEMLTISPKGTVPVLQLNDKVLDESLDIINWAFLKNPSNFYIAKGDESMLTSKVIKLFDNDFKYHLDRYKYHQRHKTDPHFHRDKCHSILLTLEEVIKKNDWIKSIQPSMLFISIMPFIRQYRITDSDYFSSMDHQRVIKLSEEFESSTLFKAIMQKHQQWSKDRNNGIYVS